MTAIPLTCDRCTMEKNSGPVGMAWDTSLGNPWLNKLILCIFKTHNEVWLYLTTQTILDCNHTKVCANITIKRRDIDGTVIYIGELWPCTVQCTGLVWLPGRPLLHYCQRCVSTVLYLLQHGQSLLIHTVISEIATKNNNQQ